MSSCQATVSPALNTTETFTGYVAQTAPNPGTPSGDVHASASVAVNRIGYTGTVTLTADRTRVASSTDTARLTATMSDPLVSPYLLSIYDDTGARIGYCTPGYGSSSCSANVSPGPDHLSVLRAYVAQDAPATTPPGLDVGAISKPVAITDLASDEALLASAAVLELESRLIARYGADIACMMLGESVRTHAARSSVPDATLICNAKGLHRAIQLIANTIGVAAALGAVETLSDAADGRTPTETYPDCDHVTATGECLDEGSPQPERPEPAPAGAGGILPPTNCLHDADRIDLRDSMPEQNHHLATHYGAWGVAFQEIADAYGLSVENGLDWNILRCHTGAHIQRSTISGSWTT